MLELVDGKIGLVIEIKTTRKVDAVCAAVRDMLKDYKGEYWIESFDPRIVRWWHEHCPDVVLGQLYDIYAFQRLYARRLGTHKYIDFIAAQCGIVTKPFFNKVRAERPEVVTVVWTVRTPDQLARATKEADNFIFESNLKRDDYIPLPDPIIE